MHLDKGGFLFDVYRAVGFSFRSTYPLPLQSDGEILCTANHKPKHGVLSYWTNRQVPHTYHFQTAKTPARSALQKTKLPSTARSHISRVCSITRSPMFPKSMTKFTVHRYTHSKSDICGAPMHLNLPPCPITSPIYP